MRVIHRVIAVGLVAVAAPAGSASTVPQASFANRVEVQRVLVDVWVEDRSGRLVSGLTATDFELSRDGRPVPIDGFEEVRDGLVVEPVADATRPAGADPTATAAVPHHLVVYVDQTRIHPTHTELVERGLLQMLASDAIDPARVLILVQEAGVSVAAPFGSSRDELADALKRLSGTAGSGLASQADEAQGIEALRSAWEQARDIAGSASTGLAGIPGGGGGVGGPRGALGGPGTGRGGLAESPECGTFLAQAGGVIDWGAEQAAHRIERSLGHLERTVNLLGGLAGGGTTLLYLSDGLEVRPASALVAYADSLCPGSTSDLAPDRLSAAIAERFERLTAQANAQRVTVHTLQSTGLEGLASVDASGGRRARGQEHGRAATTFDSTRRQSHREGLALVADQTGGRAVFDTNELGPKLADITRDMGSRYTLWYEPPAGEQATRHRLEVRVRGDGLRTRFRRTHELIDADTRRTQRLLGALNLGIVDNPLQVRVGLGAVVPLEGVRRRVTVYALVPLEQLVYLPSASGNQAELVVQLLAGAEASGELPLATRRVQLAAVSDPAGRSAKIPLELELQPGSHPLAMAVIDLGSGQASYVSTQLPVE